MTRKTLNLADAGTSTEFGSDDLDYIQDLLTGDDQSAVDPVDINTNIQLRNVFRLTGFISPAQITANQNDYNPTGLSTANGLRLSTDASRNITGLQGGSNGRIMVIHNIGSQNIVLSDESASSTAANRFALNASLTLGADQAALLQYDVTTSRWRCVSTSASSGGGGGGGAPVGAQYLTLAADATLTDERVLTAGTNIAFVDAGAGSTLTINVPDASTTVKGAVELATSGESAANVVVQGNDSRLSDARSPTAHKSSHIAGGSDPFVKGDELNAESKYFDEETSDPTTDTRRVWIAGASGQGPLKFWDNQGTAVKHTIVDDQTAAGGDLTGTYPSPTVTTDAITFAKMQNIATDRLLGRDTASSGDPEEISVSGGLEFSGSGGIQRSALTGDVTASAASNSTTIANNAVTTAKILDANVTLAKIANIATDRLLGRDTASSGVTEELTVGGGVEFSGSGGIQRSALTGDVTATAGSNSTTIANDAVSYAKMQNVSAASKLLGRGDSGSGDPQEITLGTNLSMSGTTLNASGGGGGDAISVNGTAATDADFDDATPAAPTDAVNVKWQKDAGTPNNVSAYLDVETVSNKILANMAANTVKANNTGSTGDPVDVSVGTNTVLGRKGSNIVAETIATAQIADDQVTYAKIQNVTATDRLLGRDTAAAGDIEELTASGGIEFTGTGIQTSAFTGDVTKSAGGTATTIANDAVSNAKAANMAANTAKVNNTNATADPTDLSIGTNTVLGRKGGDIVAETIATAQIGDDQVTYAKMQDISATDRLLGRDTAAAGNTEELTVGGGVEFSGSGGIQTSAFTGDVTKSAGGTATTIANNTVTYAKMQDISATDRLLGRDTAAAGDTEEISVGGGVEFTGSTSIQRSALTGDVTASAGSNATLVKKSSEDFAFTGDISPSQITANQNDYNPTNLATSTTLRLSTDASRNITGLQGGADGRIITIHNVGSNNIVLKDDDGATSTAANRFALSGDLILAGDQSCILQYDSTTSRWRLASHGVIGGGSGAPTTAQYVTLATDATLSNERVFTAGQNIKVTDGGAGGNYTVAVGDESWILDGIISPTDATDQNDYNPTNLATSYEIRWNGTASIKFTGLSGGASGREILLTNVTTDYLLWLENQNTASSAANRFILPDGRPAFLFPSDSITLRYDGTASRWRVKQWPTRGITMGLSEFNDFLGLPITTSATDYFATVNGTGASVQTSTYLENTTEKPHGIVQCDTGTQATGRAGIGPATGTTIIPTTGAAMTVTRLAIEAVVSGTETYSVLTGFNDNSAGITDGVTWEYRWNGSAAEWSQTRWAATTATRTASGSPSVSTNYIWLVIFVNPGWTRVDYIYSDDSISFTKSSSPTTGIPSSSQITAPFAVNIIKTVGTTQRNVTIDLFGYRFDLVRG